MENKVWNFNFVFRVGTIEVKGIGSLCGGDQTEGSAPILTKNIEAFQLDFLLELQSYNMNAFLNFVALNNQIYHLPIAICKSVSYSFSN